MYFVLNVVHIINALIYVLVSLETRTVPSSADLVEDVGEVDLEEPYQHNVQLIS